MANKLCIIGIGPGDKELILPAAIRKIEQCDVLIGGKRNLELFNHLEMDKLVVGNNLDDICLYISDNIAEKKIVVVVTGDTGIFSILEYLKGRLDSMEFEVIPGISSLQYLCSRLMLNWNDARILSLHGREQHDWIEVVKSSNKTIIFTGGRNKPDRVCRELIKNNITDAKVTVGQNLSYPDEKIITGSPGEIEKLSFEDLSVMIIQHDKNFQRILGEWDFVTSGIPDSMFLRGDVPMTKEEVRSISLSKLRLKSDSIVFDLGAGTGSVSIECALCCRLGQIYAIEKNAEGVELIEKNANKFGTRNITVIHGDAPGVLEGLPEPDRVFIGGTGGNMGDILDYIKKINRRVRLVINTVTLESTYEAMEGLQGKGFENIEIVNIAVSRGKSAGGKHLMQSLNPVYIISADKGEK